jgi:hypothetical protein
MAIITSDESQFTIPLTNTPQSFNIELAGNNYTFIVRWNSATDPDGNVTGWVMDIEDQDTQTPIVCNIPFITGADLLEGLEYLGINGSLVAYTNGDQWAVPDLDNLGTNCNLYFYTDVPT